VLISTLALLAVPVPGQAQNMPDLTPSISAYELAIGNASGLPGDNVALDLSFRNDVAVSGFDLLISYDASVLTVTSISISGTRIDGFDSFDYFVDADGVVGDIRLTASDGVGLATGDGVICTIRFNIIANLNFAGMAVPIRFVDKTPTDNLLFDAAGAAIDKSAVDHFDGTVVIEEISGIRPGDINLNGLAFEIGDVILLTNYLMDARRHPLDILQLANSDVNGDGLVASVADLVFMINRLTAGMPADASSTSE
jgi:hypothetical protein